MMRSIRQSNSVGPLLAVLVATLALFSTGCMVESSSLTLGDGASAGDSVSDTASRTEADGAPGEVTSETPGDASDSAVFEPTAAPAEPTPVPAEPTPVPAEPTPVPAEPTPVPAEPTPVPTSTAIPRPTAIALATPAADVAPTLQPAGLMTVPTLGGLTFELDANRPVLQLPGHTLIYVDADRRAEVDIYTPVADGNGAPLLGVTGVLTVLQSNPAFAELTEQAPAEVGGFPARVFEGLPVPGVRGFHTDPSTVGDDFAGWFPPTRLRLWLVDAAAGPLIITAESLDDPGQFADSLAIAERVIATIVFP